MFGAYPLLFSNEIINVKTEQGKIYSAMITLLRKFVDICRLEMFPLNAYMVLFIFMQLHL